MLEEALGLTEERERHREARTDGHALTLDDLEGLERAVFEHVQALGFPADDVLRWVGKWTRILVDGGRGRG